jgi:hypothetical protein
MSMLSRGLSVLLPALLIAIGTGVGFAASEAAYRAYLYFEYPERFASPVAETGYFSLYDQSLWEYDARFGFVYPPGRKIAYTGISDGAVRDCAVMDVINRHGNVGPIIGDYASADLKVAVFGDSWAAFHLDNKTWPVFLQAELERRLGRSAHVLNFGRDGYGILQMFDLAAVKVPEWKPDIALITFITDDLDRERFWRSARRVDGEARALTHLLNSPEPPIEATADTFLLHERATYDWCVGMRGRPDRDRVLEEIFRRRERIAGRRPPADALSLRNSYLLDRVLHGHPFRAVERGSGNPRMSLADYAADEGFARALRTLRESGVPVILVHLAYYPEIKEGVEYIATFVQRRQLESLARALGHEPLRTIDHTRMPVERPERMNASEDNYHPSLWGMAFYGEVVAEMLIRNGHVR